MKALDDLEQARDNIAGAMDLSRASWRAEKPRHQVSPKVNDAARSAETPHDGGTYPRSALLRAIRNHPFAAVATVAGVIIAGPSRLGSLGAAGVRATTRHASSIAPILQHLINSKFRG
ncbi:MAG: hypothetical protein ABIS68_03195 [Casimicrobiaceae bacterium]